MESIKGYFPGPVEIDITDSLSYSELQNSLRLQTVSRFPPLLQIDGLFLDVPPPEVMVWEEYLSWDHEGSAAAYEIEEAVTSLYEEK